MSRVPGYPAAVTSRGMSSATRSGTASSSPANRDAIGPSSAAALRTGQGLSIDEIAVVVAREGTPLNRTGIAEVIADEGLPRMWRRPDTQRGVPVARDRLPRAGIADFDHPVTRGVLDRRGLRAGCGGDEEPAAAGAEVADQRAHRVHGVAEAVGDLGRRGALIQVAAQRLIAALRRIGRGGEELPTRPCRERSD